MTSTSLPSGLARLNASAPAAARAALLRICASTAWADRVLVARPFAAPEELYAAADTALAALTTHDLEEALAGHPPIGRPRPGETASAREQSGMTRASADLKAEMHALNQAYERTFGHVFLICATGLTGEQMRDAAAERLRNTPEQEWRTVRTELGKINRVRLARLIEEGTMSTGRTASVSTHVLDTGLGRPAAGVPVLLAARAGRTAGWQELGGSATDTDGRCRDLPALPEGTTHARLVFDTETYATTRAAARRDAPAPEDGESGSPAFFPEVAVAFAVVPGEHYHVPLLFSPFGYSVYRGS
ncbi:MULTISPECIES: 2-oxo-4-hydroxy-4-carboxy-5-ureidoimidazoline decarboxylase [Streptomyces]|uniref:2-oxo-4-hydroxy-4-carboxy-5-ureidoimidazoline decarboxylase n=1 Tax=Streptomyces TaxID=1883 RepID=UPI0016724752|nr:2-oxo-4-hydroxy-4-carboxy-5-ureidoimidazoline decarboxylase [Streptomyces thermoviolaceus]GGV72120.1 hypothetical protein GCM10010499_23850 [Streptomyces thermoviolaceus subsp. apingens]